METRYMKSSRTRTLAISILVTSSLIATSVFVAQPSSASTKKLKLAFFSVGSNNTYLQAGIAGAKAAAKKYGATIQVFDGGFDSVAQINQINTALPQGFDGMVIEPNDGPQLCASIKSALKAKIAVALTNVPGCAAAYSVPLAGTAAFVGGQSEDVYTTWFSQALKNSSGGEFAVINGPATHGNTTRARKVLSALEPSYPAWKEVGFLYCGYQASVALTQVQTLLQQYPNLKAIFSSYSGQTPGIISAIAAAGLKGKVDVYDLGGDKTMFAALAAGDITSTEVYLPYEEQDRAVSAVVAQLRKLKTLDGVKVGGFVDLTKDPKLAKLPAFVKVANIAKYNAIGLPEY
jgi:ribose transport system substrate-binding protein